MVWLLTERISARSVAALLVVVLILQPVAFSQQPGALSIVILEGDGITNGPKEAAQRLVVQLQDSSTGPVAGAEVVFTAPEAGAGGVFSTGMRTFTARTDAQGLVVVAGFRPNAVAGSFLIQVTASYQGRMASASLTQTNLGKAGGSKKWIIIAGLAGGGAAAMALGKKSPPPPPPTTTTTTTTTVIGINPGTPTVGP